MPPPPLLCWSSYVDTAVTDDNMVGTGRNFQELSCVERKALGFYNYVIKGPDPESEETASRLKLHAEIADAPAISYLTIVGQGIGLYGGILAVDKNLILLVTSSTTTTDRSVIIVYDAIDRSLTMIPDLPMHFRTPYSANCVFVARRRSDSGDDPSFSPYAVVVTGMQHDGSQDTLFVWRPSSLPPWEETMEAKFPVEGGLLFQTNFEPTMAFSWNGYGLLVDLLSCVMCCCCDAVLYDYRSKQQVPVPVEFGFVNLPPEPEPPMPMVKVPKRHEALLPTIDRDIASVGDSILRFVRIDGFLHRHTFGDCKVTVWSLEPTSLVWVIEHELHLKELPEHLLYDKAKLAPMYPMISRQEPDVIYFAVGEYVELQPGYEDQGAFPATTLLLLRVDMRCKILVKSSKLPQEFNRLYTPRMIPSNDVRPYLRLHQPLAQAEMKKRPRID